MTNPVMYERLDHAIGVMLDEPEAALPALDAEARELVALAAELRSLPRPDFRAALDAELRTELGLPTTKPQLVRKPAAIAPEVAMPTLFGGGPATYPVRPKNFFFSVAAHAAAAVLIIASTVFVAKQVTATKQSVTALVSPELSDYQLPIGPSSKTSGGGGGGGDRDKFAASGGRLPKQSLQQLAPPAVVIRNQNPALAVEPTVVVPPNVRIPQPNVAALGDPLAAVGGPPSNGTGSGGGIGTGSGDGVGSGFGPGVGKGSGGGFGGGVFKVGGGVSAPRAIYAPDPEYSEEARRAKYQGTVTLWVVIGPDGRPRDMKVVRPLGMGLDDKAIEAVKKWKFEPSLLDGKPVAVQVNIEVNFRLY